MFLDHHLAPSDLGIEWAEYRRFTTIFAGVDIANCELAILALLTRWAPISPTKAKLLPTVVSILESAFRIGRVLNELKFAHDGHLLENFHDVSQCLKDLE